MAAIGRNKRLLLSDFNVIFSPLLTFSEFSVIIIKYENITIVCFGEYHVRNAHEKTGFVNRN